MNLYKTMDVSSYESSKACKNYFTGLFKFFFKPQCSSCRVNANVFEKKGAKTLHVKYCHENKTDSIRAKLENIRPLIELNRDLL